MEHNMLVMLAGMMPAADLLDRLENSLQQHKLLQTEKTKSDLDFHCHLYTLRCTIDREPDGMIGVLKKLDSLGKADELKKRMEGALG